MTTESKEDLLKLLFNTGQEPPHANVPSWQTLNILTDNFATRIYEDMGLTGFQARPSRSFTRNGWFIFYNETFIGIFKSYGNSYAWNSWTTNYKIIDLIADENGFYGITNYNNTIRLTYFDDFTELNPDGRRYLRVKKYYELNNMLKIVTGDNNPENSNFCGLLKLAKSPMDGRFAIATCLLNQNYYAFIEYTVNVGSDNTFRQNRIATSVFSSVSTPVISDMFVSWSQSEVNYTIGIISHSSTTQAPATINLYELSGNLYNINGSTLQTITNCVTAPRTARYTNVPQIKYRSLYERFYSYLQVDSTSTGGWYGGTLVLRRKRFNDTEALNSVHLDYVRDTNGIHLNENNIIIKDSNAYILRMCLTNTNKLDVDLLQYVNNGIVISEVVNGLTYADTDLIFSFINDRYNLLDVCVQSNDYLHRIRSIVKSSGYTGGYNGQAYLGNNSFIADSGIILNINNIPVFARDLYDKSLINNTIHSTLHIPRQSLENEQPLKQQLLGETNIVIDENKKEIEVSNFDEFYIHFIDTYKVMDNNDKSTYQSSATANVVREINEGFTDYHISNYRLNYTDGTHKDRPIEHVSIVDNEATITLTIDTTDVDNIEFYGENYIAVFATIDLSSYSGAYKLTEKVKIE